MTRDEALKILELPRDAGSNAVRDRIRERYSEYQLRLTNAPTTNLKLTYQRSLNELDEAGRLLLGEDASLDQARDLPVSEPVVNAAAPRPVSSPLGRQERECPYCAEKILPQATRCRWCGQAVKPATAEETKPPVKPPPVSGDAGKAKEVVRMSSGSGRGRQKTLVAGGIAYAALVAFLVLRVGDWNKTNEAEVTMKSDLWNLVTSQETYFADHMAYATNVAALRFNASEGVSVTIGNASGSGWRGTAQMAGTSLSCSIEVGPAATTEPSCK